MDLDWNDLRYVVALAEKNTLKTASEHLGVSHTTTWRRIQALEKSLGTQLFVGTRQGYDLTEEGQKVLKHARLASAHIDAIKQGNCAARIEIKGLIKLTAVTEVVTSWLPKLIRDFRVLHPEVTFEIIEGSTALDLNKREADIAFRFTTQPPDSTIAKQLGMASMALYCAPELVKEENPTFEDILTLPAIMYRNSHLSGSAWFRQQWRHGNVSLTCNEVLTAYQYARAGLGVALLPSMFSEGLVRLYSFPESDDVTFWMLAHPEMRNAARIKAFWDFASKQWQGADQMLAFY